MKSYKLNFKAIDIKDKHDIHQDVLHSSPGSGRYLWIPVQNVLWKLFLQFLGHLYMIKKTIATVGTKITSATKNWPQPG